MTQAVPLEDRVTDLERRMGDVEDLARGNDREVAGWQTTLNNHGKTLNGFGEKIELFQKRVDERFDKVDQRFDKVDQRFAKIEAEMRDGFAKVDANFAMVDANFAKVEDKFRLLFRGQEEITRLLTRHPSEQDETHVGGADE